MAKAPAKKEQGDDDLLKQGRAIFARAEEAESTNRQTYVDDVEFAREGKQWPENIRKDREADGRPCLTINKMPAFIRQVVNDARQNKPSIKVHPADSGADPEVAEIYNGLIRNIEYSSNADVAYDTATECAVSGGWGYIRVKLDYAYDDTFDMDISIERVANPLSVYGDPNSMAADSSDWDDAFVVDKLSKEQFKAQYGEKSQVDWDDTSWEGVSSSWKDDNTVMVAEWWHRETVEKTILQLSDGRVLDQEELEKQKANDPMFAVAVEQGVVQVLNQRDTKSCKVTQRIMTGAEILKTTVWPGKFIPIIPVYGDEFDIKGKRYLRSLIHNAKDAQRMVNFWRTNSTELVALAPRVPYIGEQGAFDVDQERWQTANTKSHPYLEVSKGKQLPQRQPLDMGVAAGSLQEALNASDDMKAVIGMYDASLGARSNETSGRAIMARQREGDVATFHFIDNMARAIRHTGRILIDLIPKVYNAPRIVRVIGEDGSQKAVPINQQTPATDKDGRPVQDERGQAIMRVYDIGAGKYDLTVTTGPSFTTRREEAAANMTEVIRAMPNTAPILAKHLAKNLDWPGADEIAEELENMGKAQIPPELQKAVEDGKQKIADQQQQIQQLQMDQAADLAKVESQKQIEMIKIRANEEIERLKIESDERIALAKADIQARASVAAAANRPAPPQRAA